MHQLSSKLAWSCVMSLVGDQHSIGALGGASTQEMEAGEHLKQACCVPLLQLCQRLVGLQACLEESQAWPAAEDLAAEAVVGVVDAAAAGAHTRLHQQGVSQRAGLLELCQGTVPD